MSFAEIDAMTMDDYADMEAYWASNPPVGRMMAAYFKLKPARVRRRARVGGIAKTGGLNAGQLAASLGI